MSPKRPALPLTGGCICGSVRYEIASFPLMVYTCNCTNCQKQSGSAFGMTMPVAARDFRILQGAPKAWRRSSPQGIEVTSWFCGDCGNRIYGERAGRTERVNVRAGTLDDTTWLKPVAHFFTRSAQPWVQPAAGAIGYETQPSDVQPLVQAWRLQWG
jgi:hypothetical protein